MLNLISKEIELLEVTIYAKDIAGDFRKWCKVNILGRTVRRYGILMVSYTDEKIVFEVDYHLDSIHFCEWIGGIYPIKNPDFKYSEIRLKEYLRNDRYLLSKDEIKQLEKIYYRQKRKDFKEMCYGKIMWFFIKGLQ